MARYRGARHSLTTIKSRRRARKAVATSKAALAKRILGSEQQGVPNRIMLKSETLPLFKLHEERQEIECASDVLEGTSVNPYMLQRQCRAANGRKLEPEVFSKAIYGNDHEPLILKRRSVQPRDTAVIPTQTSTVGTIPTKRRRKQVFKDVTLNSSDTGANLPTSKAGRIALESPQQVELKSEKLKNGEATPNKLIIPKLEPIESLACNWEPDQLLASLCEVHMPPSPSHERDYSDKVLIPEKITRIGNDSVEHIYSGKLLLQDKVALSHCENDAHENSENVLPQERTFLSDSETNSQDYSGEEITHSDTESGEEGISRKVSSQKRSSDVTIFGNNDGVERTYDKHLHFASKTEELNFYRKLFRQDVVKWYGDENDEQSFRGEILSHDEIVRLEREVARREKIRRLENEMVLHEKIKQLEVEVTASQLQLTRLRMALKPFLGDDQLAYLHKTNDMHVWADETIWKAHQLLYECGIKGYNFLRSMGMPLPCATTVKNRRKNLGAASVTCIKMELV